MTPAAYMFAKQCEAEEKRKRLSFDQMQELARWEKERRDAEHRCQCSCVQWFRLEYPQLATLLFAVPNGTNKSKTARMRFKAEGLTAGVSDLLLLVPKGIYHGLCIEMKSKTGRQSKEQRAWQKKVTEQGYLYLLCRSFDEFHSGIQKYLTESPK